METTIVLQGYILGVMLGLYWGYIGIMEENMETTIPSGKPLKPKPQFPL